jgi:hypothetical protein
MDLFRHLSILMDRLEVALQLSSISSQLEQGRMIPSTAAVDVQDVVFDIPEEPCNAPP